jgi:hypothetical protein
LFGITGRNNGNWRRYRSFLTRGIEPKQLVKLAATLDRLAEGEVEDPLAARGRPPETDSSSDRR